MFCCGLSRVPAECSQKVADLLDACLNVEATARPTAHELMAVLAGYLGYWEEESSLSRQSSCDEHVLEDVRKSLQDDLRNNIQGQIEPELAELATQHSIARIPQKD
jgi:hypothetical protein